jgi:HlyD family secretion protein
MKPTSAFCGSERALNLRSTRFAASRFQAKVSQIRNAAQTVQNVVTYIVVLDVDNAELLLRPGMTANVRVVVAERKDVILVPNAALRFKPRLERASGDGKPEGRERRREGKVDRGNKSPIFIPDGEKIHPVFVSVGITDGLVSPKSPTDSAKARSLSSKPRRPARLVPVARAHVRAGLVEVAV